MSVANHTLVVMRGSQRTSVAGHDFASSNHHGHLDRVLVEHALILGQLSSALWAVWTVVEDRFVFRIRDLEKGVGHGESIGCKGSGGEDHEKGQALPVENPRGSYA